MTVLRPIGGRGYKEGYESKVIRVPTPIIPLVNELADKFYQAYLVHKTHEKDPIDSDDTTMNDVMESLGIAELNKTTALESAKAVLAHKKSAKLSIEKLLQVIYGDNSIKL